jgi:carbonic anhydrase
MFPQDPQAALERLVAGNARFVAGDVLDRSQMAERRRELAAGQRPFAVVLTCADSRVPAELIFDQEIGDLFVVRIAGNTATEPVIIGSIEFSVDVLGSLLVFVLGHTACGAVQAAIDVSTKGDSLPGRIGAVAAPIVPAVEAVRDHPPDQLLEAATRENIRRTMARLSEVPTLGDRVAAGTLLVVGGEYELVSGGVDLVT